MISKLQLTKGRIKPRISINKLAEYLEANATRRKAIVLECKYSQAFIAARYSEAREAIKAYLQDTSKIHVIDQALRELRKKKATGSTFQISDRVTSIEALEAVKSIDLSFFDDYALTTYDGPNTLATIAGVDISVNPDLVLTDLAGTKIGAVKLHIRKNDAIGFECQNIVAMLLHQFVKDNLEDNSNVAESKLCFSYDVFPQSIVCCPNATSQRLKRLKIACEEIAMWWDNV